MKLSVKDVGLMLIGSGIVIFIAWWLYKIIWSSEFPFLLKTCIMLGVTGAGIILINMVIENRNDNK